MCNMLYLTIVVWNILRKFEVILNKNELIRRYLLIVMRYVPITKSATDKHLRAVRYMYSEIHCATL